MYVNKDPLETHTNGSPSKTPFSNNLSNLCKHIHTYVTSKIKISYVIFIVNLFGGGEAWRKVTSLMNTSHTAWHRCCRLLSPHFSWHAMPSPHIFFFINNLFFLSQVYQMLLLSDSNHENEYFFFLGRSVFYYFFSSRNLLSFHSSPLFL